MKSVFYALRRFAVTMMPTEFKTAIATEESKLLTWAYAQANDTEIWGAETEQERILLAGELDNINPEAAFGEFLSIAERGSPWCIGLVGYRYQVGLGVPRDIDQAERWYRLAVARGVQQAQLRLGTLYYRQRKFTQAEGVYQIGAAQKWAPAMYRLAWCKLKTSSSRQVLAEARLLLEEASAKGDLGAEQYLATLITTGRFGLRQIPSGWRRYKEADRRISVQLGEDAPSWAK